MNQEMKDTFKEIGELFLKMADQLEKYDEKEVDEDGWFEWEGGEQPEETYNTPILIKFRDRVTNEDGWSLKGSDYTWSHDGSSRDIIAYKIVKDNK